MRNRLLVATLLLLGVVLVCGLAFRGEIEGEILLYRYECAWIDDPWISRALGPPRFPIAVRTYFCRILFDTAEDRGRRCAVMLMLEAWKAMPPLDAFVLLLHDQDPILGASAAHVLCRAVSDEDLPREYVRTLLARGIESTDPEVLLCIIRLLAEAGLHEERSRAMKNLLHIATITDPLEWHKRKALMAGGWPQKLERVLQKAAADAAGDDPCGEH